MLLGKLNIHKRGEGGIGKTKKKLRGTFRYKQGKGGVGFGGKSTNSRKRAKGLEVNFHERGYRNLVK